MTANDAALLDAVAIPMQITIDSHLFGRVDMLCNLITLFNSWLFHNLPFVLLFYSTLYIVNVNGVALIILGFFLDFLPTEKKRPAPIFPKSFNDKGLGKTKAVNLLSPKLTPQGQPWRA